FASGAARLAIVPAGSCLSLSWRSGSVATLSASSLTDWIFIDIVPPLPARRRRAVRTPPGDAHHGLRGTRGFRTVGPEGPVRRTNPLSTLTTFYDKWSEANRSRVGKARKK